MEVKIPVVENFIAEKNKEKITADRMCDSCRSSHGGIPGVTVDGKYVENTTTLGKAGIFFVKHCNRNE